MNKMVCYNGALYEAEAVLDVNDTDTFNANALAQSMTNLSTLSQYSPPSGNSGYNDRKESLKLIGTQLQKMDLWNHVLEYFDQYLVDTSSRTTHTHLMDQQRKLIKLMSVVATKVANQYRNAKDKNASADFRTTDDFQFRKVITIFRHYLYFIALYNLQFLEYIESKVKSSEIFDKNFIATLPKLYDPPKLMYIEDGYLNPETNSDFNKNSLDLTDWEAELDDKAEQLSSGFSKNSGAWDFNKLKHLYIVGLKVDNETDADSKEMYIPIQAGPSENAEINEVLDRIHYFIVSNLVKLAPNLVRHSIKNAKKTSSSIHVGNKEISDKVDKVVQPYGTKSDYAQMSNNFKGVSKPPADDLKTVANSTEYIKRQNGILNKIRSKFSGK